MLRMFAFMSAVVTVQGSVGMFVVYRDMLNVVGFISRCEVLCVVYLYSGCDGYCAFCLTFGMEEFYSYKEKTLQKRQSRETKHNTTKKKYIYRYNYVQL